MSLIDETKLAMNYKDVTGTCEKCIYGEEVENHHVDRMWDIICTYSNLCEFKVSRQGSCAKFQSKSA